MPVFRYASAIAADAADLFRWHDSPGAFERLTPPWESVEVLEQDRPLLRDGARLVFKMWVAPGISFKWVARNEEVSPVGFTDVQEEGPMRSWKHVHRFEARGEGQSELIDEVTWEPPGGAASTWLAEPIFTPRLQRMFRFRHHRTQADLARHAAFRDRPRLRVAITGATGLIGKTLATFLRAGGHTVHPMVRKAPKPGEIQWSVDEGTVDLEALDGVDAIVHLAGASIGGQRWTEAYKQEIVASRVEGTRVLAQAIGALRKKPAVLVSGSAVGVYGDTGDRVATEADAPGSGFLADVCKAWEAAAEPVRALGVRVVNLRTGIVMAGAGGALEPQLPLFRAGLGGPVGPGTQYVPFVALEDMVGIVHQALYDDRFEGPLNATAPEPVTQAVFARTLGRVLGRPAFVPTPAAAVKIALGDEMARALALEGQRAVPARLLELGFPFQYPSLEEALRFELGR